MKTFGSVCSGIEAASVAWRPLGWRAAWLAEIEPFPSAVLAHHYPDTPNLGDMTTIAKRVLLGEVEAPDVLTGGTPCQAFSVAGLRQSLADDRGNLTLKFVELLDAIDHVRGMRGRDPATAIWENVPGVLSTKDNAFGCFLAGLAGEDEPLQPPGGKWANAGCVYGPQRAVAWRTLDAQYFGLAQRRKRVFVVASARPGFDPAQVLFEWEGVRRDLAPRREAGQEAAPCVTAGAANGGAAHGARSGSAKDNLIVPHTVGALTAACGPNGHGGSGPATDKGAEAGHILAFGGNRTSGAIDVAPALLAQPGSGYKGDFESETFVTHSLRGEGFDASEDGTGRGTPLVPVLAGALCKDTYSGGMGGRPDSAAAGHLLPAIAFSAKDYGGDATADLAPTLRAMNHAESHANGGGQMAIAFPANLSGTQHASTEELAPSMGAANPTAVAAWTTKLHNTGSNNAGKLFEERTTCLDANSPPPALLTAMQVRRLTPTECERLQGFPDDYTLIPWRKKPADECPDGPRYKALGNSWAVPVAQWVGWRVAQHLEAIGRRAA